MTETNAFSGLTLKLAMFEKPIPYAFQGPSQCELDTIFSRGHVGPVKTETIVSICARSRIMETPRKQDDPTLVTMKAARYDPKEYGNLIIDIPSLNRKYVIVIEKEQIEKFDEFFTELIGKPDVTLEVTTSTALLDALQRTTEHYYKSTMAWPLASLKLSWAAIDTPPQEGAPVTE